jgi:hypothetical protein
VRPSSRYRHVRLVAPRSPTVPLTGHSSTERRTHASRAIRLHSSQQDHWWFVVTLPRSAPPPHARSRTPWSGSHAFPCQGTGLRPTNGTRARVPSGAAGTRTPDLRRARAALSQLSYGPRCLRGPLSHPSRPHVVGAPGLEPGTSALSGPRSDHLSYAPGTPRVPVMTGHERTRPEAEDGARRTHTRKDCSSPARGILDWCGWMPHHRSPTVVRPCQGIKPPRKGGHPRNRCHDGWLHCSSA